MRALIVYESMFGNTHEVAVRVGVGLEARYEVTVVPVAEATPDHLSRADLVVVGGPTHVHSMSSDTSRRAAHDQAHQDDELELDVAADGPGVRDWLSTVERVHEVPAAAFDTRVDGPAVFTGRASKAIARHLEKHGFTLVADPESFLVDRHNHLVAGEADRATAWGALLAAPVVHWR
jgi:menaquinone-dependent protoporphyrinogen IX oxidase